MVCSFRCYLMFIHLYVALPGIITKIKTEGQVTIYYF